MWKVCLINTQCQSNSIWELLRYYPKLLLIKFTSGKMALNESDHNMNPVLEVAFVSRVFLLCVELINFVFLSLGAFGMYHGIEIQHPLYMVLFINLILPLLSTMTNLILFLLISFDQLIKVSHCKYISFVRYNVYN